MKAFPISKHLQIAGLIILISYAVFTLAPDYTPAPEDISPYVYLLSSIWLLAVCVRLPKKQKHKWAYWLVFLTSLIFMLDEAGYGVETFGLQPLYIERYHVYVHDLHNLLGLGFELLRDWLTRQRWNGTLFANFLAFDLALLLAGAVLLAVARAGNGSKVSQASWQARLLPLAAASIALAGLVAAAVLISLPRDPRNEVLLGLSWVRLISLVAIAVASFVPLIWLRRNAAAPKRVATAFKSAQTKIFAGIWAVAIACLAYQLYVPFLPHPDQLVRIERISPLVLWLLACIFIIWLCAQLWAGRLRQPQLPLLWRNTLSLLRTEPIFLYYAICLVLIFIAQAIDQELIPLNSWVKTPSFHVQLWGLWTEEAFEMIGAFLLMAGAYFAPNFAKGFKTRR